MSSQYPQSAFQGFSGVTGGGVQQQFATQTLRAAEEEDKEEEDQESEVHAGKIRAVSQGQMEETLRAELQA